MQPTSNDTDRILKDLTALGVTLSMLVGLGAAVTLVYIIEGSDHHHFIWVSR